MGRRYSAFLVRYWQLADDTERLTVEHVQSDRRIVVTSLADAFAWVRDQTSEDAGAAAPTVQRHNVVRGYQDAVCLEQGKTPPCYGPTDPVK